MLDKGRSGVVLTTILLLGHTIALAKTPDAEHFSTNDLQNLEVRNEMQPFSIRKGAVGATGRQGGELSTCERREQRSVSAFGKCPDSCQPFSVEAFLTCSGLVQFGCSFISCGAELFSCTLNEDLSSEVTVCPGGRVVFDDVELGRLQTTQFSIELKANPLNTDFYLLGDATGSKRTSFESAKLKFQEIIDTFSSRPDVAFGVGFYRDETDLDRGFMNLLPLTTDVGEARKAVEELEPSGGGDRDEANLVALYRIATDLSIGWRDRSRKIVVYIGDAPGHEPSCVSGLPTLTRDVVVDALNERKITVFAASISPGLDEAPSAFVCTGSEAGTGQASRITSGTAGKLFSSDNDAELIKAISDALKPLPKVYDVDDSECGGNVISVHNPRLPLTISTGQRFTVTNTLQVGVDVCGTKGTFDCKLKYTESGADLESTVVESVDIHGCPSF